MTDTGGSLLRGLQAPLLTRAAWGASAPVDWPVEHAPVRALVVHHTGTRPDESDPEAMLRRIQTFHARERGWGDIGYSFVVLEDGRVAEGRAGSGSASAPEGVIAGHAYGHNVGTLGIAVAGRFHEGMPADAAWASLVDLAATVAISCDLDATGGPVTLANGAVLPAPISGHRHAVETSCPGQALTDALPELRAQVATLVRARRDRQASASGGDASQNAG